MAGFDTWVQAGGAGINLPQIVNQAQVAKQNDLLLQYAPAREARAQAQETRLQGQETRAQSQENRLENIYKTREEIGQAFSLSKFISRKDIDGAIGLVSENGITEKEKPILEILNNAKNTGDMTQLEAVYQSLQDTLDRSVFMGDVKQDAAPTRKKTQGADGFWYYDDDQSRVLPNVQAKPEGGGEGERQRTQEINDLVKYHGLTMAEAIALRDKYIKSDITQQGRVITLDDIAAIKSARNDGSGSGRVATSVPISSEDLPPIGPEPGNTL